MSSILMDLEFELVQQGETLEPKADLYHCYYCKTDFDIADCDEHEEGDWENGYYAVHSCQHCGDDGGEYTMSEQRAEEWCKWNEKRLSNIKQT